MEYPQRKRIRLAQYDYGTPGAYFVTICTYEKRCILSNITIGEGLAPPAPVLSAVGRIADEQIQALPVRFPSVAIDKYVIMPNHIHILLSLSEAAGGASPSPTVIDVMRTFKSLTARQAKEHSGVFPLWQRSFHDHVIRNDNDYREIWSYIDTNPARWLGDCFYME